MPPELDDATKQRLSEEVERLVRMGMDKRQARRIVWDDYQDELAAYASVPSTKPVPPPLKPLETPVPEPPLAVLDRVTKPVQPASKASFFTPERLQRNRGELAKVKRLIGLRNEA